MPPAHPDVSLAACPVLAPHVRLKEDARRDQWVLLAPERILELDETAREVVRRLDGRPLFRLVEELAGLYDAPADVIAADVFAFIAELRAKGLVVILA